MSNWKTTGLLLLRNLINDLVEPYTYTDDRLESLLLTSAYLNTQDVDFDLDYVIDLSAETITPDSTDTGFIALMVLRAAAVLANSEWKTDSRKSVVVKDGPTSIDMTDSILQKQKYAAEMTAQFNKAVVLYKTGNRNIGVAIIGPGRFDLRTQTSQMFF